MSISQLLSSDNNDRRAVYSPTEMPAPIPANNFPPTNIAPAHVAPANRPHPPPSNLPPANLHNNNLPPASIAQSNIAHTNTIPPQFSSFDPIERRNNGIRNLLNNDNDDKYQMADSDTDTEDIPLIKSPKIATSNKGPSKPNNGKSAASKVIFSFFIWVPHCINSLFI